MVVSRLKNSPIFKSDGPPCAARNSSNPAHRKVALTPNVITPSKNGATFESDGVEVTARDSSNSA